MGLDLVTYLRTEYISAALVTNQTPRSADICLQLGTEDGRAVNFVPRTIRELVTSSAEKDGKLTISARRQLKQQADRRKAAKVRYVDQPADDLREMEDESVDVVISLQAAARMMENGLDWKKSIREAARVLKPGGRLLFVEQTELAGESYLGYVRDLYTAARPASGAASTKDGEDNKEEEYLPAFEEVGFDEVDLVLVPHTAGVAIKSEDAGLTKEERARKKKEQERDRVADLSIAAFERGLKKRTNKKKTVQAEGAESSA
jgi:SAM-dependent methyltransferase